VLGHGGHLVDGEVADGVAQRAGLVGQVEEHARSLPDERSDFE
jgi:hypothetical protein